MTIKAVEDTNSAPTRHVTTTAFVEKVKQKLLMNSDLIQLLIPNIHAKTHHVIKTKRKAKIHGFCYQNYSL